MSDKTTGKQGTVIVRYLLDLIVPIGSYYLMKSLGASDFWALVIGGLLTSAVALVNTIQRGKLDNLAVLVILEIILGIVLDITVHDPRLTLARGSVSIAVGAIWMLVVVVRTNRPISVETAKVPATKGAKNRAAAYEWLVTNSAAFLRIHRIVSAMWCVMFLAYAVIRVVIIYQFASVQKTIWLNELPLIIGFVLCFAVSTTVGRKKLTPMVITQERRMFPATDPA